MTGTRNLRTAWPGAVVLLFAGALFAAGCSTGNSGSGLNLITPGGSHPAGFVSTHPSLVLSSSDTSLCQPCHGDALDGGIAKVSCFSASRNGVACHHASPTWADPTEHGASAKRAPGHSSFIVCRICHGSDFSGGGANVSCVNNCHSGSAPHPARPWLDVPPAVTHTTTDPVNAVVCIDCHAGGANTNPPHPPPTPAAAGTAPGCFNGTLCHNNAGDGANHILPFFDNTHFQATSTTFTTNCGNCHAVTGTSPVSAAPLCTVCHTAGSPLTLTACTSCHANPPNGSVGGYPNVAGAHAKHIALNAAGTAISCNTCHNGLGTNTLNHYNRANARSGSNALRVPPGDAAFLATYNAKTGASSFDNAALSCANISCHGGTARFRGNPGTALNWQTGTLVVNSSCTSCHAQGTAQFNSYNSGQHSRSEHVSAGCTACHNTTKLADAAVGKHFLNLSTTALDVRGSVTISGTGTSIPEGNYTPGGTVGTGSCTPSCHGTESW